MHALLREAVELHEQGAVAEAAERYGRVLAAEPDNVEALFRLGRAHCQQGRLEAGIELFRKALALEPKHARANQLLGMALDRLGRPLDALACFDRAIAADPNLADAYAGKGDALAALGRFTEAVKEYDRALALDPANPLNWTSRATALAAGARLEEAIASYARAAEVDPSFADAFAGRAQALGLLGRFEEALADIDRAVAIAGDAPELHANRALLLNDLRRTGEALASADRAIALAPGNALFRTTRGGILLALRRNAEALTDAERALALDPALAPAQRLRTLALAALHRLDDALTAADGVVNAAPSPDAYAARAIVRLALGDVAGARADAERASALAPDDHDLAVELALIRLVQGEWREAARDYERRELMRSPPFRPLPARRWGGEPLTRERLVLVPELGPGEIVLAARFVPLFAERAKQITLAAEPSLVPLLRGAEGANDVVAAPTQLGGLAAFTRWLPIMSAPGLLGLTPEHVPAPVPYLSVPQERAARWAERIGSQGLRIGIAWREPEGARNAAHRYLELGDLAPLAQLPEVRLIALEKDASEVAAAPFRSRVETPLEEIDLEADPVLDAAAIVLNVDLVVAPDALFAHVAGALGRPAFTALPAVPAWYWLLDRDRTPWYPTMRLFRQAPREPWRAVFERIAAAIRERRG